MRRRLLAEPAGAVLQRTPINLAVYVFYTFIVGLSSFFSDSCAYRTFCAALRCLRSGWPHPAWLHPLLGPIPPATPNFGPPGLLAGVSGLSCVVRGKSLSKTSSPSPE